MFTGLDADAARMDAHFRRLIAERICSTGDPDAR
jgi:hypothetical protein